MELKTTYLPAVFFKMGEQVLHFLALPIFFFLFVILYKPFGLDTLMSFPNGGFAFNTVIVTAIMFVVLLITRIILWGLRNTVTFKRRTYFIWCAGEVVVISLFVALYVHLISSKMYTFIDLVPIALAYVAAILVYPYIILTLILESDIIARYAGNADDDSSRLRFYDDKHTLRFVTEPRAILYIESDENYCIIHYTEGEMLKKYQIRATLKGMEENCAKHGIHRCHRSYFVNVKRIKVLRKDSGLVKAEMDFSGADSITVSPRYYEIISRYL